jgi:hypothetical protein
MLQNLVRRGIFTHDSLCCHVHRDVRHTWVHLWNIKDNITPYTADDTVFLPFLFLSFLFLSFFILTKSMEQTSPWEAGVFSASEGFPLFYETWVIITVVNTARPFFLRWAGFCFLKAPFSLSSHLHLGFPSGPCLAVSLFPYQNPYTSFFPHKCHVLGLQILKLIMQLIITIIIIAVVVVYWYCFCIVFM